MTRLLGCLVLVLAVALPASATHPCVVRSRVVYSYPVYQAPVVAAVFAPLVVAQVPAYSATFGVPDQGQGALLAELKALRQEVQALRQGGAEQLKSPKNGNGEEVLSILQANCAECHTGAAAKGKFAMFTAPGNLAQFTPQQVGKMLVAIQQGEMPPAPRKSLDDKSFSIVNLGLAQSLASAGNAQK